MHIIMKYGLPAMLSAVCFSAAAQTKEITGLTKEGMIADYRLAIEILKKQHPNPYKFIDSTELNRKMDSLLAKAAAQTTTLGSLQYSPIHLIRDVHTNLKFSDDITKEIISNTNFFPLPVVIEKDKILVNIKGAGIPFGAELVSINEESAEKVIASLSTSSYSDGFITTGTDRVYGNFQLTLSMRNPDAKWYDLVYIDPQNKKERKIRLASLLPSPGFHSVKQAVMPVNQLARSYWIFGSYNDADKTGTLTVNSFNLQEAYAYKEFSSFFKEVNKRGYRNVIIDIRNNGGGNPAISALLFSFLAPGPFHNVYNYRTTNIKIAYPEYAVADGQRKMSEEDIRNTENFLYQRFDRDSASGFFIGNTRLREGQLENYPPDKDAFNGKVYVLTGGGTVSAATYFASLVQKNKRGMIIGKETGSGENATTAAWFLYYLLPNTKSILTVPMSELYFFNSSADNGRGILPDQELPVSRFMEYMNATEDPEWNYTLDLIKAAE